MRLLLNNFIDYILATELKNIPEKTCLPLMFKRTSFYYCTLHDSIHGAIVNILRNTLNSVKVSYISRQVVLYAGKNIAFNKADTTPE